MAENEPTERTEPTAGDPALEEADTEGHTMNYEFNRIVVSEHGQAANRAALKAARLGERARTRSLLDRFRGR
jgi:hypothetical protein